MQKLFWSRIRSEGVFSYSR